MPLTTWLLFCLSAFLIAASPGPNVLHAVRYASSQGWSKATASIVGNTLAILLACALASLGLAMISQTVLFKLVEFAGAFYLIYLGIKMLMTRGESLMLNQGASGRGHKRIMIEAFLLSLANPKILVFIASLFPQFIRTENNLNLQFLILTLTFAFFTTSTLFIYIGIAMAIFNRPNAIKIVDWVSGLVLIYLGLQMLFTAFIQHQP